MSGGRRGRGGHGGGGHGSSERWLITYADLITLLLVFFVVLYALSQVDKAKYEKLKQSLSNSMTVVKMDGTGHREDTVTDGNPGVLTGGQLLMPEQLELEQMAKDVDAMAKDEELSDMVKSTLENQGMVISISSAGFFQSGEANLRAEAIPLLDKIAMMLKRHPQKLRIEGHTDNIPISTARFVSNWELSAVRATTIVRFLIERHGVDPRRLTAAGYGEYYPKFPNDTEAHRAENRRVEIVIQRDQPAPPAGSAR